MSAGRTSVGAHTIGIPTSARMETLERVLRALAADLDDSGTTEVILVDNGAADRRGDLRALADRVFGDARGLVRVVREQRPGASRARNRVLEMAGGDVVSFLDDDAPPVAGWQAAVLGVFAARPRVGLLTGPVAMEPPRPDPWWRSWKTDALFSCSRPDMSEGPVAADTVATVNASFRRTALAGLRFDERLGWNDSLRRPLAGEDVLLALAVADRGWDAWFCVGAGVRHLLAADRYNARWVLRRCVTAGVSDAVVRRLRGASVRDLRARALRSCAASASRSMARFCAARWASGFFHLCDAVMFGANAVWAGVPLPAAGAEPPGAPSPAP